MGARAAIALGDSARARALLDGLERTDSAGVAPAYLRALLCERAGRWNEAFDIHTRLLTERRGSLSDGWTKLLAARWARASWQRDEARLRGAARGTLAPAPGRALVFPLEPLIVDESTRGDREELAALGASAAAWVIAALAAEGGGEALSVHTALRLLGRVEARSRTGAAADADEQNLPPITTLRGVARRLADLVPSGPPPGESDAAVLGGYLPSAESEAAAEQIASALAHFQGEHGLAPTGIADPKTQAALERAWRGARAQAAPFAAGTDPLRAAAARLGADCLLTGTLEPLAGGEMRWSAAWVRVSDGALLSPALSGTILPAHFREAWSLLVERIVSAAPEGPAAAGSRVTVEAPTEEGALAYGRALLFLEEGRSEDAAALLRRSSRSGGGALAAWSALAWGTSGESAQRLEDRLLDEAALGPLAVSSASLRGEGVILARGMIGPRPGTQRGDWLSGQTLRSLPYQGWIVVSGTVEGR